MVSSLDCAPHALVAAGAHRRVLAGADVGRRDAAPFESWARGGGHECLSGRISMPIYRRARWISELRQIGPCEAVAAYADWPPEETARLGISGSFGLVGNLPECSAC